MSQSPARVNGSADADHVLVLDRNAGHGTQSAALAAVANNGALNHLAQ